MKPDPTSLEVTLGHCFGRRALLEEALTHSTYRNEHPEIFDDNERLEYLGDAVLSLVAADWLFRRHPALPEGKMTEYRALLTNRHALADLARGLGLDRLLRVGRGMEDPERLAPSLLCGCVEAVAGAFYLDAGIEPVQRFFEQHFERMLARLSSSGSTTQANPKGALQEYCQRCLGTVPEYQLVMEEGPQHDRTFEFEVLIQGCSHGRGRASSKQAAQAEAARMAMERLEQAGKASGQNSNVSEKDGSAS